MTAQLAPTPIQKFFDNNGNPLFNGKLYSYVAGTSTPQATYTDSTMGTQNTNPVILNARGEANVWLDTTLSYKLVLQESNGTQIWSVDNIPGNGVILGNGVVGTVQNIAALRNVTGVGISNYQTIIVDGYTTAGDGGGGTFWWNSTSTVADDGGTIIAPTGVGTGRWYRLYSGVINVKWFGAKGDGTTDDAAAVNSAMSSLPSAGGRIYFPSATYLLASTITFLGLRDITFEGDGALSGGATTATIITSSASSQALLYDSCTGIKLKDIYFEQTNSVPIIITANTSHSPSNLVFERCQFEANSATASLELIYCQELTFLSCIFGGTSTHSISGPTNGTEYCNSAVFIGCSFNGNTSSHVANVGSGWIFSGCVFEANNSGIGDGISGNNSTPAGYGLVIDACWFGDVTVTGGTQINLAYINGVSITGNLISGNSSVTTYGITLSNCVGISIKGNYFNELTTAISITSGTSSYDVDSNSFNSCTTDILFLSPTISAGAALGTSPPTPTLTTTSNENFGRVNFGTGTSTTTGTVVTITLPTTNRTPLAVIISPYSSNINGLGLYLQALSSTSIVIGCGTAPTASQSSGTYVFFYQILYKN